MSGGVFQTDRDIFSHPIWKRTVDFRMFFLIYGKAVFSKDGYRVTDDLILQRGQWLRSTRKLQEDLEFIENRQIKRYSTSVINNCIKRLVELHMVCTKTHELGTVFTVVNYEQYQGFSVSKNDNLEHNLEHSENTVRTVSEQYQNNNKNVKKDKNEKNDKKKDIIPKIEFAEFVYLTQSEYDKLIEKHGIDRVNRMIEILDNYKGQSEKNKKKYTSDYRAILSWVVNRVIEDESKLTLIKGGGNGGKYGSTYAGPSEASRKAASQGSERFIGTPGESVSDEELARFQEEVRNFQ